MKKKNLKSLKLNKKEVSNLTSFEINGKGRPSRFFCWSLFRDCENSSQETEGNLCLNF